MPSTIHLRRQAQISQRLATVVACAAIGLFTVLGSKVVPAALFAGGSHGNMHDTLVVPLLLATALIILAWRRASEARALHEELEAGRARELRLAYFDDVTGLHNRRYLMKEVFSRVRTESVALLLLDLDGFKKVNDLYGHDAGDALLRCAAERMTELAPASADAVRLGGDEFAICLHGADATVDAASRLAARLVAGLSQPFALADTVTRIGVSIGISLRENDVDLVTSLIRRSDIAMYEAKRLGKGRAVWFDPDMERARDARSKLETEIRDGLEHGEFVPHFQPLLDLTNLRIRGFEVLARWMHPREGLIGPETFMDVAEASGLISELSLAIMRAALTQAIHWPRELSLAFNVSPIQFKDPLLADRIQVVVRDTGFDPKRLEVEVSELALLHDNALTLATIHRLKDAGVRISLDDFGTGYAALSRFSELPFDRIKIDRNFVHSLRSDRQSDAIVRAIAALGKTLSLPITAEGIEEETIQDLLVSLGATEGQGWLYGKALAGADAARAYLNIEGTVKEPTPVKVMLPARHDRRAAARR